MELIGRLHPLILHLPIGILLYAFLHWTYEHYWVEKPEKTDLTFPLSLGALAALFSAISGWGLASEGGYDEDLLNWHKYLGFATAGGAIVLLWSYRKWTSTIGFGLLFFLFTVLLGATGHYGGSLTHGVDFLSQSSKKTDAVFLENIEEAHIFKDIVLPIIDRKCVSCHNPQKAKGELLLHDLAGWQAGGKNGPILLPESAEASPLIQRLYLPKEDELHMPPAGKLQPTNQERDFLQWWVNNMEHYDHQVKDLNTTPEIDKYLQRLLEVDRAKPERPSATQLAELKSYGMVASLQSIDDPWVDIYLAKPDSFVTDHLKRLRKIAPAIQSIDLSNSKLTDVDLKHIQRLENVEHIRLNNCQIRSTGISYLKHLPYLRTLNLYGTQVDSSVFETLLAMDKLEKVYIWQTPVEAAQLGAWQPPQSDLQIISGVDFAQFGSPELMPPSINAEKDLFTDSLLIDIETKAARGTIHYTLDSSDPTPNSPAYTTPFYIDQTTEVKAILTMDGWTDSEPITRTFIKSRFPIASIQTNVPPHENYQAEGVATLADLKKGSNQFSDGNWLGYSAQDLQLTADLGEAQEISGVTIGTLADYVSYIHLPLSIKVLVSTDGHRFRDFQEKEIPIALGPTEIVVHNHLLRAPLTPARYIRIEIESQKSNPDWHPAPGADSWLFVDEVLVE